MTASSARILKFGAKDGSVLPRSEGLQKSPNFKFERPDWTMFRSVGTLSQKAGVSAGRLRRLVLKELTDNALDAGAEVEVGDDEYDHGIIYSVRDYGPGIDGTPADIARMFSINRPMASSKLWRMPQRGALGNGLRVVAGAVAASDGWLRVTTRNQRMVLTPQEDGSTAVESEAIHFPVGTLIEIVLGSEIPDDDHALSWARGAIEMSRGSVYTGRTSPHWYDGDAFFDILQATDRPVREFIANLDGCSGARAGDVAGQFKGRACDSLSRNEAVGLLMLARSLSKPVRPERLGAIGPMSDFSGYGCRKDSFAVGGRSPEAAIPFVVEAWATPVRTSSVRPDRHRSQMFINRTPITGKFTTHFEKGEMMLWGCGLAADVKVPRGKRFDVFINITTPYCPITTDGKEPDLSRFDQQIVEAVQKAINGARRAMPTTDRKQTQKSVVLDNLDDAIDKASGGRKYRFNLRQVYYVLRPIVQAALSTELTYNNLEGIITDYEKEHGDIEGMYRDPRGTLYHPHTGENIALGTLAVEQYSRPAWTFNKVLYIEKEGFFEALKAVGWPEQNDCALLTSKGYSTRAVRDFLDLLGDDDEPVTVFCVHDADGPGTMIYQTLQEETKARPRRRVEIINLGLEPWEAVSDMRLPVENIEERQVPVADYVASRTDGDYWTDWFQTNRVELNEMSTPGFIEWLDAKMEMHGTDKIVPPSTVIDDRMNVEIEHGLRLQITDRILIDAKIDDQIRAALDDLDQIEAGEHQLRAWFEENQGQPWINWVREVAVAHIAGAVKP
jgi:DNA topoisomerase 6 subunit A-like protein